MSKNIRNFSDCRGQLFAIPDNRWTNFFLEAHSVVFLQCICQHPGSVILKTDHLWRLNNSRGGHSLETKEYVKVLAVKVVEITYKRVFETAFEWETKRLFTKWSLTRVGRLWEVFAMRELTVLQVTGSPNEHLPKTGSYNIGSCLLLLLVVESL